jgi:hypothetical protein
MFPSTLPPGVPELMRVSAFRRYLQDVPAVVDGEAGASKLSSLNPSLMQDLMRFDTADRAHDGLEVLEVLAACLRHGRALLVHLQDGERVVPLTVFPVERLVHCPVDAAGLFAASATALRVLHVEPALLRPPGHAERARIGELRCHQPLGPLLWALALHGAREDLLPEIAGPAAYRVAPAFETAALPVGGVLAASVQRLQRATTPLREIAEWPGFDRARAMRLLNALYLQGALIVTRTHPAATSEGWFGAVR